MTKIIDSVGKGGAINASEHDANLSSLHGINQLASGTTFTVDNSDQGDTIECTNAGICTVTLTAIATVAGNIDTDDFKVTILAGAGSGGVTINRSSTDTIGASGATSYSLVAGEWVVLQTDSSGAIWNIIGASRPDGLTNAEVNTLSGLTSTTAELNKLDGVTSTTAELNILDGVTATAAELNIMDGVVRTTAQINEPLPVGFVFISTVSTNPNTLLGYGTWTQTSRGRVLLGEGTSDKAYTAAATGGASAGEAHGHAFTDVSSTAGSESSTGDVETKAAGGEFVNGTTHTHTVSGTTSDNSPGAESNMPPYLVVYIWERTA